MIKAIDHIVILVSDLATARADYERLGFTVVDGGEHTDGSTHNALVSFADGTYLELLAFRRAAPQHRWWRHSAAGEGLIDFALLPDDTAAAVAEARARGLDLVGPTPGGRARPDGVRLEWQSAFAERPELPFLCGDVTPRELRVPGAEAWGHANEAAGVATVTIAVRDLDASAAAYSALLGQQPAIELERRVFHLGAAAIILRALAPDEPDGSELEAHLATRGEGIYALGLRGPAARPPLVFDRDLAHGVRMALVPAI